MRTASHSSIFPYTTLFRSHWVKRVLFLVDRLPLQEQALLAFKEHLAAAPRWPEQEETGFDRNRRIYVTTYPTMLNLIHGGDRKSTRLNSSHRCISYAVFCM